MNFSAQMDRQAKNTPFTAGDRDVFLAVALPYQTDSQLSRTPCFVFHVCVSSVIFIAGCLWPL